MQRRLQKQKHHVYWEKCIWMYKFFEKVSTILYGTSKPTNKRSFSPLPNKTWEFILKDILENYHRHNMKIFTYLFIIMRHFSKMLWLLMLENNYGKGDYHN